MEYLRLLWLSSFAAPGEPSSGNMKKIGTESLVTKNRGALSGFFFHHHNFLTTEGSDEDNAEETREASVAIGNTTCA